MKINTTELNEFIFATTKSISQTFVDLRTKEQISNVSKTGKDDGEYNFYMLSSALEFEISVIIKKTGKGKINLLVADIGGDYKKEIFSKIKFTMESYGNMKRESRARYMDRRALSKHW